MAEMEIKQVFPTQLRNRSTGVTCTVLLRLHQRISREAKGLSYIYTYSGFMPHGTGSEGMFHVLALEESSSSNPLLPADKYAADSSSSEFFMIRDDHLSYHDIREKVDAFSTKDHFSQERNPPIVIKSAAKTTIAKLTFEDFLEKKPKLMEDGEDALPTSCGMNILRGLLERIIQRYEEGTSGGLKPKSVLILDGKEGHVKIDPSTVQRCDMLSGLKDDLSGFKSVIELIAAKGPSRQANLNGFKNALISCSKIRFSATTSLMLLFGRFFQRFSL